MRFGIDGGLPRARKSTTGVTTFSQSGPEHQALAMQRPVLAGSVEGKHVVAALDGGTRAGHMHLLGAAVEAGMHDQRRPWPLRFVRMMEVAGQRGLLVGNLDPLDQGIVQLGALHVAIHREPIGARNPRIVRIAVEEELGALIVGGRAQKTVPGADAMVARQLVGRFLGNSVGAVIPGAVPAVVVAGCDARSHGQNFAEQRAAIFGGAEGALGLEPELGVVGKQRRLGGWRGARCGSHCRFGFLGERLPGKHGDKRGNSQKCSAVHRGDPPFAIARTFRACYFLMQIFLR